jgi:hypothetical protein
MKFSREPKQVPVKQDHDSRILSPNELAWEEGRYELGGDNGAAELIEGRHRITTELAA